MNAVAANSFQLISEANVSGWLTTDSKNEIEIWGNGFLGRNSFSGSNFAEINANSAGSLYQEIATTPIIMIWSVLIKEEIQILRLCKLELVQVYPPQPY